MKIGRAGSKKQKLMKYIGEEYIQKPAEQHEMYGDDIGFKPYQGTRIKEPKALFGLLEGLNFVVQNILMYQWKKLQTEWNMASQQIEVSHEFAKIVNSWSIAQCEDYVKKVSYTIDRLKYEKHHMLPIWNSAKEYVQQSIIKKNEQARSN